LYCETALSDVCAEKVKAVCPWLRDSDTNTIRIYCELEILTAQCYAGLRMMGVINGQGEARRLLEDCRKMRVVQLAYASALGLTACARAALGSLTHEKPVLDLEAFRSDDRQQRQQPE